MNLSKSQLVKRRQFLKMGGAAAGILLTGVGCGSLGYLRGQAASGEVNELDIPDPISITTPSGMRVHGIQTGWISIKSQHYHSRVPEAFKELAVITDTAWTEPKPILSWIIEHPEGLIVIDSGERAGAKDLESYLSCADAGSRYFITRNFRVNVEPENELGPQLQTLGLSPDDVRWCLQTHLHFDHANGFDFVPKADVLVARAELEGHKNRPMGAVACKYPAGFDPRPVDYLTATYGPFEGHYPVTEAGDVVIVPTHGHSYGHQSVVLRNGDVTLFFAGDVVYDEHQLFTGDLSGINVGSKLTRASMVKTQTFLSSQPTVFLPSHDPMSLPRLRNLQIS